MAAPESTFKADCKWACLFIRFTFGIFCNASNVIRPVCVNHDPDSVVANKRA
jgi:hypothetical protein